MPRRRELRTRRFAGYRPLVTLDQGLAFAIVAAMMGLFVGAGFAATSVAMLSLLAALAVGIVPFKQAFT